MSEPAISVEGLKYSYGKTEAVKGINFEIAPGEILGFLGPNGAGKSTTIKILTGQLRPDSGTARVLGFDASQDDPRMASQIGVCFEEKNLYETMSAEENLRFHASLFGIKRFDAKELLDQVGLADRAKDRVSSYSKGMRQRLMMARALVNQPKALFLDEPTDGLDPVSSATIRELIKAEAEQGTSILLTTHDMWEADQLSNRVAFINEGKLYALDTPDNLKQIHGKRSIKIKMRSEGATSEESLALDDATAGDRLKDAIKSPDLMTIHTEEATLESIFIKMTGRRLEG